MTMMTLKNYLISKKIPACPAENTLVRIEAGAEADWAEL